MNFTSTVNLNEYLTLLYFAQNSNFLFRLSKRYFKLIFFAIFLLPFFFSSFSEKRFWFMRSLFFCIIWQISMKQMELFVAPNLWRELFASFFLLLVVSLLLFGIDCIEQPVADRSTIGMCSHLVHVTCTCGILNIIFFCVKCNSGAWDNSLISNCGWIHSGRFYLNSVWVGDGEDFHCF